MENNKRGKLYLVGTPIGNLKDITLRALETLKEVDIILAEDTRQTLKLLNHYEITKKLIAYHKFNENEKLGYIKSLLDDGNDIALVSDAGMPCISDPGEILVKELVKNNYEVEVIPGVTAFVTALVKSTFTTNNVIFRGFLDINKKQRKEILESIKNREETLIFYEAPHKLLNTLKDLYESLGEKNICVARELTKIHEEYKITKLSEAIDYYTENTIKGEIVLIIEGIKKEEKEQEEKAEFENKSSKEAVLELINKGLSKKEAIKKIAKIKDIDKNEIYKECLDI